MKRTILWLSFVLAACAHAQIANVPAQAQVSVTLPNTTVDGQPLTGANALTEIDWFAAQASIPDASTMVPTAKTAGNITSWNYTISVPNGTALYFRIKACNTGGCSAFSTEVSKAVKVSVPGAPSGVLVTVTVTVTAGP